MPPILLFPFQVAGVLGLCVGADLVWLRFSRRIPVKLRLKAATSSLGALLILGGITLWSSVDAALPAYLRSATLSLYLAGCIAYVELKSILSRGYSLRILLDLSGREGGEDLNALQNLYGAGKGLKGLLEKRVLSMAALGLLSYRDGSVGPLTPLGRLLSWIGAASRRMLRLERVG